MKTVYDLSVTSRRMEIGRAFSPRHLFLGGVPGVWYDPSAPGTLFQDAAASVPASAPGHPVGRIKDKSGNGIDALQSVAAARPILARVPVGGARNIARHSTADIFWKAEGTHPPTVLLQQSHLGHSCAAISFAAGTPAGFSTSRGDRAIAGVMHPITPGVTYAMSSMISLSRQLTGGEQVTVYQTGSAAANHLYLGAGNTAALVNAWLRIDHPVTVAGTTGTNYPVIFASQALGAQPLTVYIRNIQIEVGAAATAYQRTTTIHDVTQEGLRDCWYLSFDGVDDRLETSVIAPNTDKALLLCAQSKGRDTSGAILAEFGPAGVASSTGSFSLAAPNVIAPGANYRFDLRGDGPIGGTGWSLSPFAAPSRNILEAAFDIGGAGRSEEVQPLVDSNPATMTAVGSASAGSGSFGNHPLYLGRRSTGTHPFSCGLFGLVLRFGPAPDPTQIARLRHFLSSKAGFSI
jgi:hypothetical protein